MNLSSAQVMAVIGIVAAGTLITRILPFVLFPHNRKTPKYMLYLGDVLPFSAISLLVVYCLKNVSVFTGTRGIPEGIGIIFIIAVHIWKENILLSIGGGTLLYMLLVQFVFV